MPPTATTVALGFPEALTRYVFGADAKRGLLFLVNWPVCPDHVVALPMLKPEQAAREGGAWEPVLMSRADDGSALALWRWIPEDA